MILNNFEKRMFKEAQKIASTSEFDQFHVGCVIVYQKKIIGCGCNSIKSHPQQKYYNRKYRHFNPGKGQIIDSVHAEMRALNSISYPTMQEIQWNKVKIFVYRISKGHKSKHGMARPCPACMNALKDAGIKHIYYSTNDGYAYEELD